jgi:hypothetical protein
MGKEEDEIQKPIFLCHSRESGNPGVKNKKSKMTKYKSQFSSVIPAKAGIQG